MRDFSIQTTLKHRVPRIDFSHIANKILPNSYSLSLVLIGDYLGKKLNQEHKGRSYATNVLSFPLSHDSGEIFINVRKAAREAPAYNHSTREHIAFLFIHGALHLAGHDHGDTMEQLEQKYMKLL